MTTDNNDPLASALIDPEDGGTPAPSEPTPRTRSRAARRASGGGDKPRHTEDYWRERVRVQFHEADDLPPSGISVQVNGVAFLIKPGAPVSVPRFVLRAIDNAVSDKPMFRSEDDGGKITGYRSVPRFSYTVLTAAEV